MIAYFVIFILITLFSLYELFGRKSFQPYLLLIVFFLTFIFVGFRTYCDNDYRNYITIFNSIKNLSYDFETLKKFFLTKGIEPGFVLLNILISSLGLGYPVLFAVMALLTLTIVCYVFMRVSPYPVTSYLLYWSCFFLLPFTQIRFALSMAITLYACMKYSENKKVFTFFVLIIVAVSFHGTAIVGVCYFLSDFIKITRKSIFFALVATVVIAMLDFSRLLGILFSILSPAKFSIYETNASKVNISTLIINCIFFIPSIIWFEELKSKSKFFDLILRMMVISLLFSAITMNYVILSRFSLIYSISLFVLLPVYYNLLNTEIEYAPLVAYGIIAFSILKYISQLRYAYPYQSLLF